ncbi:hypothetical protein VP01_3602g1 [Puccinia sorghi]|uniref:Acyl-protein thioesterase 1 n=1 Tax=Puccinia sorghi TaxID=27349 RepID=A0A0L6UV18_9BASI|nr:hypothetical protein VP01_3602g1 [Puccinia sorghi]
MDAGKNPKTRARPHILVRPIASSVEALTSKASFLKRSYNGADLRSLHLSTEKTSFKNANSDSPHLPTHSFGITFRPSWKTLKLYFCIFLFLAALIVMICLTAIGFGERKYCLDSSHTTGSAGSSLDELLPPRERFTSSEYRANWTSPNSDVLKVDFDFVPPLDSNNGRGLGWTVVFIHGLGSLNASDGYAWRDTLLSTYRDPLLGRSFGGLTGLKFLFPKAPVKPVTVYSAQKNQGARPMWFDIKDWRDLHYLEDEEGLRQSIIGLSTILKDEVISGAVMSVLLTLTLPQPPAACIMMSGYLPLPLRLADFRSPSAAAYKTTSLYWLHGTDDAVLRYNQARAGMKLFSALFSDSFRRGKFKTFPGLRHRFNPDEEKIVSNYIDGMVSRNTGGLFDSSFDTMVQPENEGDVIQFTTP